MKYLKYFEANTPPTPEEERVNDILDKMLDQGKDSLNPDDFDILKNGGGFLQNKKYIGIPSRLEFELDRVENQGDSLKVFGTLFYKRQKFQGWFTIPTTEQHRGQNYWDFLKTSKRNNDIEFDPDPEDVYELDSMIQEIEFDLVDQNIQENITGKWFRIYLAPKLNYHFVEFTVKSYATKTRRIPITEDNDPEKAEKIEACRKRFLNKGYSEKS